MNLKGIQGWGVVLVGIVFFGFLGCSTSEKKFDQLSKSEKARLLIEVANGALLEGDSTGALQNLVAAENFDSELPDLHHSFALAYFGKKDLNSAIEHAKKAVKISPKYSDAQNTLGQLLIEQGRYQEAIPPLSTAAKDDLYRDAYKAWTGLGMIYYRQGEYTQAGSMFERAVQDAPEASCVAHYYLGHVYLKKQDLDKAVSSYEAATRRICAKFGDAHLALGVAYERSKQFNLAKKKFLEVQMLYPKTKLAEQAVEHIKNLP